MTNHTLGPWRWTHQTGGGLALIYGDGDYDGGVVIEAAMTEGICVWNHPADAHLIAAAPDLLEALEAFAPYFRSLNDVPIERATIKADSDPVRKMSAAIAKARGET